MKSKKGGRGVPRHDLLHRSSRAQVVTRAPLPLMNSGNAVPMAHGNEGLFQGRLKWPLSLGRYGHGMVTCVDVQGTRQIVSQRAMTATKCQTKSIFWALLASNLLNTLVIPRPDPLFVTSFCAALASETWNGMWLRNSSFLFSLRPEGVGRVEVG